MKSNKPILASLASNVVLLSLLSVIATPAFARQPPVLPEPSMLSLFGAGTIVAIIAYRLKNKK